MADFRYAAGDRVIVVHPVVGGSYEAEITARSKQPHVYHARGRHGFIFAVDADSVNPSELDSSDMRIQRAV